MRFPFLALLFVVLASGAYAAGDTPYNKGVVAWRAKDYAEARRQWQISLSDGGSDEALNNFGYLLYYGLGGEKDRVKAVELWRKGSALGVSEAQWHLGNAYEEGGGVARSYVQAYAWYKCATATAGRSSKSNSTEAMIEKDARASQVNLLTKLTAAERQEGDRLASEYVAKYADRLSTAKP